jgi:hypothetical protein
MVVAAGSVEDVGLPAPVSTALFDAWTPEQLSKPGNLANYGNHNTSVQRRAVGADPEIHDGFSHIRDYVLRCEHQQHTLSDGVTRPPRRKRNP